LPKEAIISSPHCIERAENLLVDVLSAYTNDRAVSVLNNAANLATNIAYKPFGGMTSITYGNGIAGTVGYDNQYRITSIAAGAVQNLSYSQYDANGNITGISNTLDATKNKSFTRNTLGTLLLTLQNT
jgi:hypothetical protein